MSQAFVASDIALLDLLRQRESMGVSEMAEAMEVTATAIRQRLTRLLAQGLIERLATQGGRGRPSHRYSLTAAGRRKAGSNFGDLAIALWKEIRQIEDLEVRRGLLGRIAGHMATMYADQVEGSREERMQGLVEVFAERKVPFAVERSGELPVLTAHACPYPELAEQDRTICAVERMMFSELVGENLRLSRCRLDGDNCCTFEPTTK